MAHIINIYQHSDPLFVESFDDIIIKLTGARENDAARVLVFCGTDPLVGTTTVTINLALSLALAEWKVLLVDGDMRKQGAHKHLGGNGRGLSDYLRGAAAADKAIHKTNQPNLDYLPCGASESHPLRLLGSMRFPALLEHVSDLYHFVLIDSPSVAAARDLEAMLHVAEKVYVVSEPSRSTRDNLAMVTRILRDENKLGGVIVNKVGERDYRNYRVNYDYFEKERYLTRQTRKKVKKQKRSDFADTRGAERHASRETRHKADRKPGIPLAFVFALMLSLLIMSAGVSAAAVPTTGVTATAVPTTGVTAAVVPTTGVTATTVPTTGVTATAVPTTGVTATAVPTTGASATAVPTTGASATALPTETPSALTSVSAIVLTGYTLQSGEGDDSYLTLKIKLANQGVINAYGVLLTYQEADLVILPAYGTSNQVYFPEIAAGEEVECEIPLMSSGTLRSFTLYFTAEYRDANGYDRQTGFYIGSFTNDSRDVLLLQQLTVSGQRDAQGRTPLYVLVANQSVHPADNVSLELFSAQGELLDTAGLGTLAANASVEGTYWMAIGEERISRVSAIMRYENEDGNTCSTQESTFTLYGLEQDVVDDSIQSGDNILSSLGGYTVQIGIHIALILVVVIVLACIFRKRKRNKRV